MNDERTPLPVPVPLRAEQSAAYFAGAMPPPPHEETSGRTISINRVHVPLLLTISAVVTACVIASGIFAAWNHTTAHAANQLIHVPESDALHGGGTAYKNDVWSARTDFDAKILEEDKRVRRLLRMMEITCKRRGEGGMVCRVELPLDE